MARSRGPQRPQRQAFDDGGLEDLQLRSMQSPSPVVVGCPWDERDGRALATSVLWVVIGKRMKPTSSSPFTASFITCKKVVCTPTAAIRLPGTLSDYRGSKTRLQ